MERFWQDNPLLRAVAVTAVTAMATSTAVVAVGAHTYGWAVTWSLLVGIDGPDEHGAVVAYLLSMCGYAIVPTLIGGASGALTSWLRNRNLVTTNELERKMAAAMRGAGTLAGSDRPEAAS